MCLAMCYAVDSTAQFMDAKAANEHFKHRNYSHAIPIYRKLLQKEKFNTAFNHKIGICYLNSNIDKTKAIPYLKRVIKQPKFDAEVYYDLAKAYQFAHSFNEAIEYYKIYDSISEGKKHDEVARKLETCETAKILIKNPIDVTFENLGELINSAKPDYYPFVAKDESYIVFTSRRTGAIEFDGFYQSDIYYSENINGSFQKAKQIGALVNSEFDDQVVGLSDDARKLFIYFDNIKSYGDIYTSVRINKRFERLVKMGSTVNASSLETSASISADGSTLFFTSDRPGGYGGHDLYMTRKLPNNEWALPQNLGPALNTQYNEDFPTLSGDGQTLYFCSQGHNSMGGYDIFTSSWDYETNSWSAPENIGYPINTAYDNMNISFSEDGYRAYISQWRQDGFGDLDVYRIIFPKEFIIRMQLPTADPENPLILDAYISVEGELLKQPLNFSANRNTGFYTIVINSPGSYELFIEADGYKTYTEHIDFSNSEYSEPMTLKIIKLQPE